MTIAGRSWSTLDLVEARQLYESGLSFEQVAQRLGYTKSYLSRRFRAAAIPRRPSGRPLTTPGPVVDIDELVRLREAGWTFPKLGERFGITTSSAWARYRRARGIPLRTAEIR